MREGCSRAIFERSDNLDAPSHGSNRIIKQCRWEMTRNLSWADIRVNMKCVCAAVEIYLLQHPFNVAITLIFNGKSFVNTCNYTRRHIDYRSVEQ